MYAVEGLVNTSIQCEMRILVVFCPQINPYKYIYIWVDYTMKEEKTCSLLNINSGVLYHL